MPEGERDMTGAGSPEKDCRECRDYRDCAGKPWYSYSEVRWCPYQVLWLIEHLETLLIGNWPTHPEGSSYTDSMIKRRVTSTTAYYTKPCEVASELEWRIRQTGVDGKLLIAEVLAGKTYELSVEAQNAFMFIKGWRRKLMSYQRWKAQRKYRGKRRSADLSVKRYSNR